jgi:hypothetical protein
MSYKIAFTRAVMFLSYIKGANVHEWVQSRVRWLAEQLTGGALQNDEYLYRETHTAFQNAFTDTMTMQKAKNEIQNLKMKEGDVDGYTARFEQLCRLGNYDVNDEAVIDMYRRGTVPETPGQRHPERTTLHLPGMGPREHNDSSRYTCRLGPS